MKNDQSMTSLQSVITNIKSVMSGSNSKGQSIKCDSLKKTWLGFLNLVIFPLQR